MNYFISDLHFGHGATLYCFNRPFLSVEDMDTYLVQQWNKRVTEEDTVYICGDISFYDIIKTKTLIRRLKGKKSLYSAIMMPNCKLIRNCLRCLLNGA